MFNVVKVTYINLCKWPNVVKKLKCSLKKKNCIYLCPQVTSLIDIKKQMNIMHGSKV